MKYVDAHCHVQFSAYDEDRAQVLASMEEAGVGGIVVGVDAATSVAAVQLVAGHGSLWASVGLHPNSAHEFEGIEVYRKLAEDPKVVAIGECGLDNYRPEDPAATKAAQRDVFEAHIQLAVETGKPLIVHARPSKGTMDAYEDALDLLGSYKREHGDRLRGDMHFFVGDISMARGFIDLDFTLSYTAVLTFAREYDEVVRFAPLSHLLSETDSPYVAPAPNRGKRNDPRATVPIVEAIAAIRGEDPEAVRVHILQNAAKLFKLPADFA
ncbi:MAG TPA: TatD family hydrolase [Candidatus Paceibacterota bacterium]|jgi:TatD DNase family protein